MRKIVIYLTAVLALSASACSRGESTDTTSNNSVFDSILSTEIPSQPVTTPPVDTVPPTSATEPEGPTTTTAATLPAVETDVEDVEPGLQTAALTTDSIVTLRALGPVRIGMSVAEASEAAGLELRRDLGRSSTDSCYHVNAGPTMRGVSFTVVNDLIRRINIDPPSPVATRSGVGIGTTAGDLREVYSDNIQRADSAAAGGQGWAFVPNDEFDDDFRIYFEIEAGAVARYRLGSRPSVDSPIGCQ